MFECPGCGESDGTMLVLVNGVGIECKTCGNITRGRGARFDYSPIVEELIGLRVEVRIIGDTFCSWFGWLKRIRNGDGWALVHDDDVLLIAPEEVCGAARCDSVNLILVEPEWRHR